MSEERKPADIEDDGAVFVGWFNAGMWGESPKPILVRAVGAVEYW